MSKSVFAQCDGVVARVTTSCTENWFTEDKTIFRVKFDGDTLTLPVTGFALEMSGNYQFLHTVSDFIYFYSFGDRVGELSVTGMAFITRACNSGIGGFFAHKNSICDLYEFYRDNRASKRQAAIAVTFNTCDAFWAFLTGMRLEVSKPDIPVMQWVLRLHVIPKN